MNKRIAGVFFLLACLCGAYMYFATVEAGETTLTWTLPTGSEQCVFDSTPPVVQSTEVWGLVSRTGPTETSVTLTGLLPGDYEYISSVTNTSGLVSRLSGAATKTIGPMMVLAGATAYQTVTINSGFWMIPMATVDANTECDASVSVNGTYYRIPNGSFTWNTGTTARPVMLVAECG